MLFTLSWLLITKLIILYWLKFIRNFQTMILSDQIIHHVYLLLQFIGLFQIRDYLNIFRTIYDLSIHFLAN